MYSSKQIFEIAEKNGISRGALGIKVFGREKYANIYILNNPTEKTLMRLEKALRALMRKKREKERKKLLTGKK